MGTKAIIIAVLWGIAIFMFALVGLTVEDGGPDYNFIGLGLALSMAGFALEKFWNAP